MATYSGDNLQQVPPGVYVCTFSRKNMARHIVCVLDRTVGHVSICWDYVSIFIYKNSNYNKINQITHLLKMSKCELSLKVLQIANFSQIIHLLLGELSLGEVSDP